MPVAAPGRRPHVPFNPAGRWLGVRVGLFIIIFGGPDPESFFNNGKALI